MSNFLEEITNNVSEVTLFEVVIKYWEDITL